MTREQRRAEVRLAVARKTPEEKRASFDRLLAETARKAGEALYEAFEEVSKHPKWHDEDERQALQD